MAEPSSFDQSAREAAQARGIVLFENGRWYCAVTNPNCQRRAELELYALGYRTFTPKRKVWISHARVRKAVERPILGRYLFIHLDPETQSFGPVRLVNGVEAIISFCGNPVAIPDRNVMDLMQRQMAGEWDEVAAGSIEVGARIRIMEGEFADMLATVTGTKGKRIDYKLLGTKVYGRSNQSQVRAA